jgi:hypothetical protein
MMAEKYTSSAKVIDGILILSLPDAISPVVWQMELGQSKSSALEIRNSDDGKFILTLKTPRQDVLDIATYANKDVAIKALLVTSQALEKAQGQLKAGHQNYQSPFYPVPALSRCQSSTRFWGFIKKTFKYFGILLGGLILIGLISLLIGKLFLGSMTSGTTPSASAPVSADEFFENR